MEKRTQPKWSAPEQRGIALPNLQLYNSLTNQKEKFVPESGALVKWYCCGPTVYDLSHLGHARRILKDYFKFEVKYVVNITDIDDKIIVRARQNHLINTYKKKILGGTNIEDYISKAIERVESKSLSDPDPDKRLYLKSEAERLKNLLSTASNKGDSAINLFESARDAIADVLDAEYGNTITDQKVFEAVSKHFEEEYHADMKTLNILPPDTLVRVTEFIEPIIEFVKKIVYNGFAYVSPSGSVYFDTNKFAKSPGHFYAKLVPTAFGDKDQLATGEGELSATDEKRSINDFALWKASKPGEPSWPSPWGKGRPGWHIECSVMASKILGSSMDIHSGGVDLKFPHHDNELAQSEAYFGHSHWVHYFLHSGHLTISGCKMSKSLKNFITIRDALKSHSPRVLRLTFLMHSWRDTMDYSADTLAEATNYEKTIVDFLYNCTSLHLLAKQFTQSYPVEPIPEDQSLLPHVLKAQHAVYEALCDSLDTRSVLVILKDLVSKADQLIFSRLGHKWSLVELAYQSYVAARLILRILRIFGVASPSYASQGSPVPVGAVVAGGPILEDDLKFTTLENELSLIDSRSWISLDVPTLDLLSATLKGALSATSNFINALKSQGDRFQTVIKTFASDIQTGLGLTLDNLSSSDQDLLERLVRTQTQQNLSDLTKQPYALETQIWPILLNAIYALTSVRQTIRERLVTDTQIDKATKVALYKACDQFRDVDLVAAGIRLQDRTDADEVSRGMHRIPTIGLMNLDSLKYGSG